jgi:hypothetical protein
VVPGNITKIIWVACTSPTVNTRFALYRSTTSAACPSSGKLVADNLVKTLPGFVGFFQPTLLPPVAPNTAGSIAYGETQTVDVDIPVSLKQGTAGVPFDLKERLALSNTVWAKSQAQAALGCSASVPCFPGPCDYLDPLSTPPNAVSCFPPKIT